MYLDVPSICLVTLGLIEIACFYWPSILHHIYIITRLYHHNKL